ncbi:THAP domain-containing protein 1 [Biomphalaria glabrata]|nr:THAP domain-containing protein 1 [Biomphalaria glabrata]
MVNKCCVPFCKGNYNKETKAHVFQFPKDEDLKKKWLEAIPRKDFTPTGYSKICHKHFKEEEILWVDSMFDFKAGKLITAPRSKPKLKEGSVPSKFPMLSHSITANKPITIRPKSTGTVTPKHRKVCLEPLEVFTSPSSVPPINLPYPNSVPVLALYNPNSVPVVALHNPAVEQGGSERQKRKRHEISPAVFTNSSTSKYDQEPNSLEDSTSSSFSDTDQKQNICLLEQEGTDNNPPNIGILAPDEIKLEPEEPVPNQPELQIDQMKYRRKTKTQAQKLIRNRKCGSYKETEVHCQTDISCFDMKSIHILSKLDAKYKSIHTSTILDSKGLDALVEQNSQMKSFIHAVHCESGLNPTPAPKVTASTNVNFQLQEVSLSQPSEPQRKKSIRLFLLASALVNNDEATKYYTGLPTYDTFHTVVHHASKYVPPGNVKLALEDEAFIVLAKLRLNLGLEDFSYRCGLGVESIKSIFHTWLEALYFTLGGQVLWPETNEAQFPKTVSDSLFENVKCIINCVEIFIEKPRGSLARDQTSSSYKGLHSIKFLLAFHSSGSVIYLSSSCGGKVKDKQIILESDLLDKLTGTKILADREYEITEELKERGVELIIPVFPKESHLLSAEDKEQSLKMSKMKKHIQQVMAQLKDFKILREILPVSLVHLHNPKCDTPTIEQMRDHDGLCFVFFENVFLDDSCQLGGRHRCLDDSVTE